MTSPTKRPFGDRSRNGHYLEHWAALGTEPGHRSAHPVALGLRPVPECQVVERTYGRLMLHRRPARDYETLRTRSEAMIHLAMTDLQTKPGSRL